MNFGARSAENRAWHLVSCRNLLIYLDSKLQEAIIPVFHYALAPKGILLLGVRESDVATEHTDALSETVGQDSAYWGLSVLDAKSPHGCS